MTHTNIDEAVDNLVESMAAKICPLHNINMKEIKPFTTPDLQHVRHRFRCSSPGCRCEADFVDDVLKGESIVRTLLYFKQLESEKEFDLPQ